MQKQKIGISLVAAIGAAWIWLAASPALAEGSWTSNMKSVPTGFNSRSWQDSHLDGAATVTTFSGCTFTFGGGAVSSVTLTLWDEMGWFPDASMGTKTNSCGVTNWGVMTRSDLYHWSVDKIQKISPNDRLLNVATVRQTY